MKCSICGKPDTEGPLFEGISIGKIILVCSTCAEEERVPLIKKPDPSRLEMADERVSVRERMERLSGFRKTTPLSEEENSRQSTLSRLRAPPKKEMNEKVVDNYDWNLMFKRRRMKLSLSQLSEKVGISKEVLYAIEHGKIPENFEEVFAKLEDKLGIKLLKMREEKIRFKKENEEKILESVRKKMESQKQEVTLNDLIERKKKKKKKKEEEESKKVEEDLIGDDLEIEEI